MRKIIYLLLYFLLTIVFCDCSGTDIPNGVSNGDSDEATVSEDTKNYPQIIGRVSGGFPISNKKVHILDRERNIILSSTTDSNGNFIIDENLINENSLLNEPNYPLTLIVTCSPPLMTIIPHIFESNLILEINPVTSLATKITAREKGEYRAWITPTISNPLVEEKNIPVFFDESNIPVNLPIFDPGLSEKITKAFFTNGEKITESVFGRNSLSLASGVSDFRFFWGQELELNAEGSATPTSINTEKLDHEIHELEYENSGKTLDLLIKGLSYLGNVETVMEYAIENPNTKGRLLEKPSFLFQLAQISVFEEYPVSVFNPIADEKSKTILESNFLAINSLVNDKFHVLDLGITTQDETSDSAMLIISGSKENSDSEVIEHEPLSLEEQNRIFLKGIEIAVNQAQKVNCFLLENPSKLIIKNIMELANQAIIISSHNLFENHPEIPPYFLETFVETIAHPVGSTIGLIPDEFLLNNYEEISDNVLTSASNLEKWIEIIFMLIVEMEELTRDEEIQKLTDIFNEIILIIGDKDISDGAGGISSEDMARINTIIFQAFE